MQEHIQSQHHFRMVQLSVFTVLLLLSGERDFGIAMNTTYNHDYPLHLPSFRGTYGDVVVILLSRFLLYGPSRVGTLYDAILMIRSNISAYMKSISMAASSTIVMLFEELTRPVYWRAHPHNHFFAFYPLEMFNNLVHYHYEGCCDHSHPCRRLLDCPLLRLPQEQIRCVSVILTLIAAAAAAPLHIVPQSRALMRRGMSRYHP
jgi:hypothetical protein